MPNEQGKQANDELEPVAGLYVPDKHGKQAKDELEPVKGLYVPEEQGRHADGELEPVEGLYLPTAQFCKSETKKTRKRKQVVITTLTHCEGA